MAGLVPTQVRLCAQLSASQRILRAVLVLLLAVLFVVGARIVAVMADNRLGISATDGGDYVGAEAHFHRNLVGNWIESWIGHYNEGVARHEQERFSSAVESYERALETVPRPRRCMVALNMAYALEAWGDQEFPRGNTADGLQLWERAKGVAADAQCAYEQGDKPQEEQEESPDEGMPQGDDEGSGQTKQQETIERLESKLDQGRQEEQRTEEHSPDEDHQDQQSRQRELEANSKQAEQNRQHLEDKADDLGLGGGSSEETW